MNKIYSPRFIFFVLLINSNVISCINHPKDYYDSICRKETDTSDPAIVFNLIDCLNESNKKVIALASISFQQNKDPKTLRVLLKIKKKHQKIDADLLKLTEKNLIIIPKFMTQKAVIPDSLKEKNPNSYLLKSLEDEINNQITILEHLEKNAENNSFETFSKSTILILKTDKEELKKLIANT